MALTDRSFGGITAKAALAIAAALTLANCSTSTPVTRDAKQASVPAAASADFVQDPAGFTIMEPVHVGEDIRAEYDNAIRLLEQKQTEQGVGLLAGITQRAPNVTAPHIDLGIAYSRAGELDKAEASLKRALELNARHPVAYNELGMLYRRKGQFAAARTSYEKAIVLAPGFHFARRNLAILCDLYLADLTCALDQYLAYQQSVPDDPEVSMWIADLRSRASR